MSDTTMDRRGLMRGCVGLAAAAAVSQPVSAQEDPYDGWFDDTDNYEGTVDYSGQDSVTVTVGAGDQGIRFDPPAIQVDPGTTVVWEWTGAGGSHSVTAENGRFESDTVSGSDQTFEHTFGEDTAGEIFRYVCMPHQSFGMVGAVAVGDVVSETIQPDGSEADGTEDGGTETDGTEDGTTEADGPENGDTEAAEGDGSEDEGTETEGSEEDAPPETADGLSTDGFLAVFGGVLATALLSPLIFALILKFIYEDDKPTQEQGRLQQP